jgi:hypothetical protein
MTTATAPVRLGVTDRCDRCGVQAYVLVKLQSGMDLQFCAHHYTQHAEALKPLASEIVDESHLLLKP